MKRWLIFLFVLSLGLSLGLGKVYSQESRQRVIVVYKEALSSSQKQAHLTQYQAVWGKDLRLINAASASLTSSAIARVRQDPKVLRVDPDVIVMALETSQPTPPSRVTDQSFCDWFPTWPGCSPTPTPTPTPTPGDSPTPTATPTPTPTPEVSASLQPIPWNITKIKAPDAWAVSSGSGIKVAVIDTGIDTDHPDLKDNLAGCVNFIQSWKTCEDDNGHGTHVSGIVAAVNNNTGVVGVSPQAKLYAYKVLNRRGSGYLSDIIEALERSISDGVGVINMSLGTSSDVQSFHDAITKVYNAGITEVAAAGNSGPGSNTVLYPAAYPEVIAAAATDSSNNVPSWSSRGPQVDIAAPGVSIYSTYFRNGYATLSGTSMASPHVTGVAALRLFVKPGESPSQMRADITANADPLAFDPTWVGAGLVNAYKVVTAP